MGSSNYQRSLYCVMTGDAIKADGLKSSAYKLKPLGIKLLLGNLQLYSVDRLKIR